LALEHRDEYQSEAAALTAIAGKLGCSPDSLRVWMRQAQRDGGERPGPTSAEIARIKELEREVRELRQANEILRKASAYFAQVRKAARHRFSAACSGSTAHFANDGFHSLPGSACLHAREGRKAERHTGSSRSAGRCSLPLLLPGRRIAKQFCREGTFYDRRAIMRDPDRASARAKSDAAMSVKIDAAWDANRKLYGARKIWHVLRRQGEDAAPLSANACIRLPGNGCTVERLMRRLGIRGVVRGKKVITTNPDTSLPCPDDKVNRLFMADRPNKLCPYSDASIAYRVTGFRFYLRAHMVGNSLCGVRDRCVCTTDRGLARLDIDEDPVRAPLSADLLCKSPAGQRTRWSKRSGKKRHRITRSWFTIRTAPLTV
jgi:transposase-like protein